MPPRAWRHFPPTRIGVVPHIVVTHPNAPEGNLKLFRLFGGLFRREAAAEKLADDFGAAREELRLAAGWGTLSAQSESRHPGIDVVLQGLTFPRGAPGARAIGRSRISIL